MYVVVERGIFRRAGSLEVIWGKDDSSPTILEQSGHFNGGGICILCIATAGTTENRASRTQTERRRWPAGHSEQVMFLDLGCGERSPTLFFDVVSSRKRERSKKKTHEDGACVSSLNAEFLVVLGSVRSLEMIWGEDDSSPAIFERSWPKRSTRVTLPANPQFSNGVAI